MTSMRDIAVADASAVAEARREAAALASTLGFGEVQAGHVAIVATELATNLLKHGNGGHLLVGSSCDCVDLLALDNGPGMHDVAACMADGYSTTGTPGNGLGAVRRLSQHSSVVSWPGRGTAVLAQVALHRQHDCAADVRGQSGQPAASIGAVVVPKAGELACGDAWAVHDDANGRTVFMVDGLGHGTEAAVAAAAAVGEFRRNTAAAPAEVLRAVHGALRHTRGAAVAVAQLRWGSGTVLFAGVGNIAGTLVAGDGSMRRMVSHSGTAGHNARRFQVFEYPCHAGVLVLHSDGLGTSWSLASYPGLLAAHPLLQAAVLYRDFNRGRDDVAVVVARTMPPDDLADRATGAAP